MPIMLDPRRKNQSSFNVTTFFLCLIVVFGFMTLALNLHISKQNFLSLESVSGFLMDQFTANIASLPSEEAGNHYEDEESSEGHVLAGLNCDKFGGPSFDIAQEMVYWEDIASDAKYVSPFKRKEGPVQYLTFEPDQGGWNNIRMSMETVLAMAFAMGRTLVLPPEQVFYLLGKSKGHAGDQRHAFGFNHFFHMESIHKEHPGLDIITMEEFLTREAMTGKLLDQAGNVAFPPRNMTNWDGQPRRPLYEFLRATGHMAIWTPEKCMAAFPSSPDPKDTQALIDMKNDVDNNGGFQSYEAYVGKPFPVDAPPVDRMKENWAGRKNLCLYDNTLQQTQLIHFPSDHSLDARLLVHFYAFLFFEDWKQDLFMKRFVRDHVRYIDSIQCAAARVVAAVRERARNNPVSKNNTRGEFDTFHIRRGDFQYTVTRFDAPKIYDVSKSKLNQGETIYIATDERDKAFFKPLMDKYDVVFLDDFHDQLEGVNTNYFGMIDQLVASRGRTFFGCWFSTFTGYIMRLRGYHADSHQDPGYEKGIHNSWYYALEDRYDHMQTYYPVKQSYYAREFPTAWRLIDSGIEELAATMA